MFDLGKPCRLRHDYDGGPPPDAPFDLVPAVVSTYGGWHPDFAQWWRGVVRTAAERSGSLANQHALLWRTVGFLSVTLQRQQFQVLAGCAPTLGAEVAGRLGNPLSEAPEFWRAAPEAAVAWTVPRSWTSPLRLAPRTPLVSWCVPAFCGRPACVSDWGQPASGRTSAAAAASVLGCCVALFFSAPLSLGHSSKG